jgi:16S rRNA (adenine1518-N6/adenine1519-N6)-dimethyltransferase
VDAVLDQSGIEPTRRGESLDLAEFIALADAKAAVGAKDPRPQEA